MSNRGQGITPAKLYRWIQQDNGNYTIFDVDFFCAYRDESHEKIEEVTTEDLQRLASICKEMKEKDSFYPRINIGHQRPGTDNRPAIGYLDFMNVDGDKLVSDFVEITPKGFEKIKAGKYPYRSAEISDKGFLRACALLESREPFFTLPILALQADPSEMTEEYALYQRKRNIMEEKLSMSLFKKTKDKSGANYENGDITKDPPETDSDPVDEGDNYNHMDDEECPKYMKHYMGEQGKRHGEMVGYMEKMCQYMCDEGKGEDENKMQGGTDGEDMPPHAGVSPSSVAMQAQYQSTINAQTQQIDKLTKMVGKIYQEKENDTVVNRLSAMAQVDEGINFQAEKSYILSLESKQAKEKHLEYIGNRSNYQVEHHATAHLKALPKVRQQAISAKYQEEEPWVQKLASDAAKEFQATTGEAGNSLRGTWGTVEKFVEHVVEEEKINPGNFANKLLRKA